MSRPRVLLVSESCNPDWVSLPLAGWGHTRALHDIVDLHLVTKEYNRDALLRQDIPPERITFVSTEVTRRAMERVLKVVRPNAELSWTTVTALKVPEYYLFEFLIWRRFRKDLARGRFDLVHRLTPMSPVMPSYLAARLKAIGVPFVLGPLNGGLPYPPGTGGRLWKERDLLSRLRGAHRLLPLTRSTRRDPTALLLAGGHVLPDVPAASLEKCFCLPEVGVFPERTAAHREGPVGLPVRVATTGRLVPLKAVDLLLRAAAGLVREGKLEVHVLGDGPERRNLEAIVADEGIGQGVTLHGWVPHRTLGQVLKECDVFAFPSLKELGGGAVVEAMAAGLVPIVVDYGGPGEIVRSSFGLKVPLGSEPEMTRGFALALARLVEEPSLLLELRARAREHAWQHFTWPQKAKKTLSVYEWALRRGPRPDLPFEAATTGVARS
jgi:glycosyltransferase involved in cell wall biosynthesis